MGICIEIRKLHSEGTITNYIFSCELGEGEFCIDMQDDVDITYYKKMPNDKKNLYFNRAAYKVIQVWRDVGLLPERATWAS